MLGVDDPLLAVVGPGVGPGGPQCEPVILGEREQPAAVLALAVQRVGEVGAGAGDDLDLRGDQLTRDVLVQQRVARASGVEQLFEAWFQLQRGGVQQRELLLQADGAVHRLREGLHRPVEVQAVHATPPSAEESGLGWRAGRHGRLVLGSGLLGTGS